MISFITGKPGGGKGLLSMQQIVDELVQGKRHIICNTPVRLLPWVFGDGRAMIGLKSYLLQKYKKDFDCEKRIHILDDDDISAFFLWRVVDDKLVKAEAQTQKKGDEERVMDFDTELAAQSGGVLYVIDEAWKFYSARNWQKTGEATLFYAAQHRHFGDDVLIVTQHTKQIDPAIQRVAQDFWVVTNHSKLSMGIFRQPDIFSVAIYDQAPNGGQLKPMTRKVFKLDKKGLAQTYDTSAGVGLVGRMAADVGARRKGLPWWGIVFLVAAIGYVAWKTPMLLGWMVGQHLKASSAHPTASQTNAPATMPAPAKHSSAFSWPGIANPQDSSSPQSGELIQPQKIFGGSPDETNDVVCTGYFIYRDEVTAFFSDGTTAYADSGEIQKIEKHWVTAWNKRFRIVVGHAVSPALPDGQNVTMAQNDSRPSYGYNEQPQSYSPAPVNQVEILPSIRSQASDIPPTPRINGIHSMQGFQSQN